MRPNATTPPTYALWKDTENSQFYAVRLQGDQLTGIVGAIDRAELRAERLPGHPYDEYLMDLPWANAARRAGRWQDAAA